MLQYQTTSPCYVCLKKKKKKKKIPSPPPHRDKEFTGVNGKALREMSTTLKALNTVVLLAESNTASTGTWFRLIEACNGVFGRGLLAYHSATASTTPFGNRRPR